MDKHVQLTLVLVLGAVVLGFIGYSVFSAINPQNTISVNGEATIDAIPDLVTIYFEVQTNGDTSAEATQENAEIVDDVVVALLMQRFERKDIQTQNFNVYPDYKYTNGNRQLVGYTARHSLRLEMPTEDAGKIGEAIDAGVGAGATISYINFELTQEKQNEYKAEVVKQAAEDARIKADSIAEGLGKKVGRLVSVSTSSFDYYPWRLYEAQGSFDAETAKTATTNIQPGEQKISARVSAVFKISNF